MRRKNAPPESISKAIRVRQLKRKSIIKLFEPIRGLELKVDRQREPLRDRALLH